MDLIRPESQVIEAKSIEKYNFLPSNLQVCMPLSRIKESCLKV